MKIGMDSVGTKSNAEVSLTQEEKEHIKEVFYREMVPKLRLWNARIGTLNCKFAGEKYSNWTLLFKQARGFDFDIVGFEYDFGTDSSVSVDPW
jgi:hypothetical protein